MNENKSIGEWVKIAHSMAKKHIEHNIYPTHEDLAQNALVNVIASKYKRPTSTIYYSLLNDYNRKTKPALNETNQTLEFEGNENSNNEYKTIEDKIALQDFFEWLPTSKAKDIFYRNIMLDDSLTDIAKDYGCTRQNIHVYKTRIIEKYKEYIKGEK